MGNDKLMIGQFIPVMKPTYADYADVIEAHGGKTWAEIKKDGYRVQIHKWKHYVKMFTSSGNEFNYDCYPDVMQIAKMLPTCIVEAEVMAQGRTHFEAFKKMRKRFRGSNLKEATIERYLNSGILSEIPLSIMIFDTLKFERRDTLYLPLSERREDTERFPSFGIDISQGETITTQEALEERVKTLLDNDEEGVVCKDLNSAYMPGEVENIAWVKFKRSEPLDLVIVGAYLEDGVVAQVLCATYNNVTGRYETLGKVSVKRVRDEVVPALLGKLTTERPSSVDFSDKLETKTYARHKPHMYLKPENSVVLQVRAMNIDHTNNWSTCGLQDGKSFSMRIGFADYIREDKNPTQATRTSAVKTLHDLQMKGVMK